MTLQARDVPCNGCTACCRGEAILLHPEHGDRPHEHGGNVVMFRGRWMLKHKPDSDECVYLGENGCTLYGKRERPVVCREFDCRSALILERRNARVILSPAMREAAKRMAA